MTQLPLRHDLRWPLSASPSGGIFAICSITLAVVALLLAGWMPLGFSIVTVFLFAGPHNWIEARYFLSRLPARWGKLRSFFVVAFAGIFGLTLLLASLPWFLPWLDGWADLDVHAYAIWNSLLVAWVLLLIQMRSRQNPRRDWSWTIPIGLVLLALTWIEPIVWSLGLVYLHPMMAFWILDRELRRGRPEWRGAYHGCLACVPLLIGVLWWRLADAPPLPGSDALSLRITQHAGAFILQGVSSHLLVATHTFLEMLHYSVWLLAIPLVGLSTAPWRVRSIALAKRSMSWRFAVISLLALGGIVVVLLWGCFLADYPTTRDVYFTVAMLHVLAEVPFLLRTL